MQQAQKMEEEKLWWVSYVYKCDLEKQDQAGLQEYNAFFYAIDEEALHKCVAGWQHYSKHDGVVVRAVEQVPLGFNLQFVPSLLKELPAQAKLVSLSTSIL